MKGFCTSVKVLLVGSCAMAVFAILVPKVAATPIEILSSDYHIWGDIGTGIMNPTTGELLTNYSQTYNQTSSSPISDTVVFPYLDQTLVPPPALATSTTAIMAVASYSHAWDIGRTFPFGDGLGMEIGATANAYAQATWTFRPLDANLDLAVNANPYQGMTRFFAGEVSVMDLTTGTELYDLGIGWGGSIFPSGPIVLDPNITFDVHHTYSLALYTAAFSADDGNGLSLSANFTPVPEPSTLLLLGSGLVGLGGMAWRRRRKEKGSPLVVPGDDSIQRLR